MSKMVIVHNSDGRPCGWGVAPTEPEALAAAQRQYAMHSCYPGEERGEVTVHNIYDVEPGKQYALLNLAASRIFHEEIRVEPTENGRIFQVIRARDGEVIAQCWVDPEDGLPEFKIVEAGYEH